MVRSAALVTLLILAACAGSKATSTTVSTDQIDGGKTAAATLRVAFFGDSAAAGQTTTLAVFALDANNGAAGGYVGAVSLSSSDASAILPAEYTFTSLDNGLHLFQVQLKTTGPQTVGVKDTQHQLSGSTTITATSTGTLGPTTPSLAIIAPPRAPVHVATHAFLVALDGNNNVLTSYANEVTLSTSAQGRVSPSYYTFSQAAAGVLPLSLVFDRHGSASIHAVDVTDTTLVADAAIDISLPPCF